MGVRGGGIDYVIWMAPHLVHLTPEIDFILAVDLSKAHNSWTHGAYGLLHFFYLTFWRGSSQYCCQYSYVAPYCGGFSL